MKTYAEERGQEKFNWFQFLSQENITPEAWRAAYEKAAKWTTCACGNQCSIIPRDADGAPRDSLLQLLGGSKGFLREIGNRNTAGALAFLAAIERRAAELIVIEKGKIPEKITALGLCIKESKQKLEDLAAEYQRNAKEISGKCAGYEKEIEDLQKTLDA